MLPAWVVVETKSSCEEVAERQLRNGGYRVYCPRYRRLLSPHGLGRRQVTSMRPLFPGLVFVQDWRGWPQVTVTGAIRLMPARPGIAKISDADIALILERERAGDFDMIGPLGDGKHRRDDLAPGDEVEFETAFGTRIMGVLDELTPGGKAIIWAVIFGRVVRTEVGAGALSKTYGVQR